MDTLDGFSRTFLPLAAQAGIPMPTLSRHMPIFRRYVATDDPAVLVARCSRPESPMTGSHLLVLTKRHLVVTSESRLLHRPRLHLESTVAELETVTWSADPIGSALDLALSTPQGRERFWIRTVYPRQLWRLDASLVKVFRASADAARRGMLVPPRSPRPRTVVTTP
jgi:hypothetical protein